MLTRQGGRGRRLVPVEGFEIVADELLVEAGRIAAEHVVGFRPEAAGIRGQDLVDQDDLAVVEFAELELGVREDDPAAFRVLGGVLVDAEGEIGEALRLLFADQLAGFLERHVFIVPLLGFRRGSEERLVELFGQTVVVAHFIAADGAVALVFLPGAARQVAAHDALHRDGLDLAHDHRTPFEVLVVLPEHFREVADLGAEQMVLRPGNIIEPEQRHRGQDAALVRDAVRHHAVERADAVGRNE